jgi:hypothetical protein
MFRRLLFIVAAPLLLSSCFLVPAKFVSELQVMRDGTFAYSYDGEIQTLALSKLAEMGAKEEDAFSPSCWSEEDFEDRECTEEEISEQRANWEANAESRRAKADKNLEMMKAMLGGIDPSSPEAAEEFAAVLERQKGWDKVEYRGNGLYEISVRIAGRLDHGFVFPLVEKMPTVSPFVTAIPRDDDRVRIDAPGFVQQSGDNPIMGSMSGLSNLGAAAAMADAGEEDGAALPFAKLDGTFRIVTDGRILANNTDEGPSAHPRGASLDWKISPRTAQAPTALIAFD